MTPEKRNAAPNPSVGADVGQQFVNEHSNTIADRPAESNENFEQEWKKAREFFRRVNDPAYLPTVTMEQLYDTVYEGRPPVIDGLAAKTGRTYSPARRRSASRSWLRSSRTMWRPGRSFGITMSGKARCSISRSRTATERLQERMYRMFWSRRYAEPALRHSGKAARQWS